ncbi:MAG TPA: TniQ family protein [Cyclobacteriaceae bacterium]|jgi:hypothetical protein|nr:TniQ family protein [Cyclobacteriaceae bacterium]
MIAYFPDPYPDELLYSIVARYIEHTNSSQKKGCADLFGTKISTLSLHLPNNLLRFVERITCVIKCDIETLMSKHTIYPLIGAFSNSKRKKSIVKYMLKGTRGRHFGALLEIRKESFGYCPLCAAVQRETYGEAFWTRCHNIPFVTKCVVHDCDLAHWVPSESDLGTGKIFAADLVIQHDQAISTDSSQDLSRELVEILQGKKIDLDEIHHTADKKGFAKIIRKNWVRGDFFLKNLRTRMSNKYPSYARLLESPKRVFRETIMNRRSAVHPVLFLMVLEYVKSLNTKVVKCINPFCGVYEVELPPEAYLSLKVYNGTENGFFATCPECGIKFIDYIENQRKPWVLDYGKNFQDRVRMLKSSGLSFNEISRRIGVCFRVVKKIVDHRWKPQLRDAQHWLVRQSQKPRPSKRNRVAKAIGRRKVDLIQRDRATLAELQLTYRKLDLPNVQRRISKTFLLTQIKVHKKTPLTLLPESGKFICQVAENWNEYKKRQMK